MEVKGGPVRSLSSLSLVRVLPALFQGFDEIENFGGHSWMQIRSISKGAVEGSRNDGLEGFEEGAQVGVL